MPDFSQRANKSMPIKVGYKFKNMKNNEILKKIYWAIWAILVALHLFGVLHFLNAESVLNYFGLNINNLGYIIMIVLLMLGVIWFFGVMIIGTIIFIIGKIMGKNAFEPENMMNYVRPVNLRINRFFYNTGLFINKFIITLLATLIIVPILRALNILQDGKQSQFFFLLVLIYCLIEILIPLKYLEKLSKVSRFKNLNI